MHFLSATYQIVMNYPPLRQFPQTQILTTPPAPLMSASLQLWKKLSWSLETCSLCQPPWSGDATFLGGNPLSSISIKMTIKWSRCQCLTPAGPVTSDLGPFFLPGLTWSPGPRSQKSDFNKSSLLQKVLGVIYVRPVSRHPPQIWLCCWIFNTCCNGTFLLKVTY